MELFAKRKTNLWIRISATATSETHKTIIIKCLISKCNVYVCLCVMDAARIKSNYYWLINVSATENLAFSKFNEQQSTVVSKAVFV